MKERKTFYSVKHGVWGANGPAVKWFDNKKAAYNFYKEMGDYCDKPVAHTVSKPETIADYAERVQDTENELAFLSR